MRFKSTGVLLALVAVLAMSAVAAASASAAAPEFKFGPLGKFPNPSYGESGAVTLETKAGRQVKCQASKIMQEMAGFAGFKNVHVSLNKCQAKAPIIGTAPCKSADANSEEIVTNKLTASLVYIDKATKEADFQPEDATTFRGRQLHRKRAIGLMREVGAARYWRRLLVSRFFGRLAVEAVVDESGHSFRRAIRAHAQLL